MDSGIVVAPSLYFIEWAASQADLTVRVLAPFTRVALTRDVMPNNFLGGPALDGSDSGLSSKLAIQAHRMSDSGGWVGQNNQNEGSGDEETS
jgi:hypothetical protein